MLHVLTATTTPFTLEPQNHSDRSRTVSGCSVNATISTRPFSLGTVEASVPEHLRTVSEATMNASIPNCFRTCVKYTQITLCHYLDLRSGYMYVAFAWELPAELVLPWLANQAVRGVTKKLSCSLKFGGRQHSSNA